MFRLLELQIYNHKFLDKLKLNFAENSKDNNEPFTSLIIGPNGTGKSEIISIIANIFREQDIYNNKYKHRLSSKKTLVKAIKYSTYKRQLMRIKKKFVIKFLLNNNEYLFSNINAHEVKYRFRAEKSLPNKVIAISIFLNDRFPMVKSGKDDIYQYMGVRRSPQVAGTRDYIKKIVNDFSIIANKKNFRDQITKMLQFLGFKNKLCISHYPRNKSIFFNGDLTIKSFHDYFKNWKKYSNRKTEPWSINYYKKIYKDKDLISDLVDFINFIVQNKNQISSRSWVYLFNIFEKVAGLKKQLILLDHLRRLDILSFPGIEVEKNDSFDIENTSSGEYHFLLSFLGILSKIEDDSLILLDEPDISLHPNWQMKYINALKSIFSEYKSCHFIIVTHSHFLISDLEPKSSSLIALTKDQEGIISQIEVPKSTYGWSAENILFNVFGVRSVRNYYFEENLRDLLLMISNKSTSFDEIKFLIEKLSKYILDEKDPLNKVLLNARKYIQNND